MVWFITACDDRGECGDLLCVRSTDITLLGDGTERTEQLSISIHNRDGRALRRRSEGIYVDEGVNRIYWSQDPSAP